LEHNTIKLYEFGGSGIYSQPQHNFPSSEAAENTNGEKELTDFGNFSQCK